MPVYTHIYIWKNLNEIFLRFHEKEEDLADKEKKEEKQNFP